MTKPVDIAITFTGLMGFSWGDPETPVVIRPLTLRGSDLVRVARKWMQPSLIGERVPVLCIEQRRRDAFIAYAAKHGVTAKWMALSDYRKAA